MLQEHANQMTEIVEEEKARWEKETNKIEEELKEGDWAGLWKRNRSKKTKREDNMPLP